MRDETMIKLKVKDKWSKKTEAIVDFEGGKEFFEKILKILRFNDEAECFVIFLKNAENCKIMNDFINANSDKIFLKFCDYFDMIQKRLMKGNRYGKINPDGKSSIKRKSRN